MCGNGTPNNMSNNFVLKNLKSLPYGGASSVTNPDLTSEVCDIIKLCADRNCLDDANIQDHFVEEYYRWITRSQLTEIRGIEQFPVKAFSNGTSESFDKFYLKNSTRRFRCFRGEYMYHPASWRNYFPDWCYLEDQPLDKNDAVVLSTPFSDTGRVHTEFESLLSAVRCVGCSCVD
jgi:hypothetical protein